MHNINTQPPTEELEKKIIYLSATPAFQNICFALRQNYRNI